MVASGVLDTRGAGSIPVGLTSFKYVGTRMTVPIVRAKVKNIAAYTELLSCGRVVRLRPVKA